MAVKLKPITHISILLIILMLGGCAYLHNEIIGSKFWDYKDAGEKAECIQEYGLAAEYYRQAAVVEIDEYKKEYSKSCTARNALSHIYEKQGKYDQAMEVSLDVLQVLKNRKETNGKPNYSFISAEYEGMVDICLAQGKFDEAYKNYEQAAKNVDLFIQMWPYNSPAKVLSLNPVLGKYYVQVGDYAKAKKYFQETLDLEIHRRQLPQDIAVAKNNLGMAYYYEGDYATAEALFGKAGGANAHAFAAFNQDFAISLTMLGKIAEHHGEYKKALNDWQTALKVLRADTWPESKAKKEHPAFEWKVEQADIWNQIGRFYLKQGNPVESVKAYNEAIRFRLASQTQTHPNCADAYKGLADVSAYKGELTSATLQATKALDILDKSVVPTHPRAAQELVALASIHILSGHPDQAAPLDARLDVILQKPLGPWKEDFLETSAFYAGLLKKAGKTAEATRLEKLQSRQKDGK